MVKWTVNKQNEYNVFYLSLFKKHSNENEMISSGEQTDDAKSTRFLSKIWYSFVFVEAILEDVEASKVIKIIQQDFCRQEQEFGLDNKATVSWFPVGSPTVY